MARLTAQRLAEMRKLLREEWTTAIDFDKSLINGAFQAIEDEYERTTPSSRRGFKQNASNDIDTAASPTKTFTATEKKMIGRAYLGVKFDLEAS